MTPGFIESLNTSAAKTYRQILKSEGESALWDLWKDQLDKRTYEFDLAAYRVMLDCGVPSICNFLSAACDLADIRANKIIKSIDSWFAKFESLVLEMNAADEPGTVTADNVLYSQLLGELGLLLGTLFPEFKSAQKAENKGREILAEGLADLLDGAGLPESENFFLLRPLLACWTRCQIIGKMSGTLPWKSKSQEHFEWAVLQTLRFTRKDGSQIFSRLFTKPADGKKIKDDEILRFSEIVMQSLAFDADLSDKEVAQIVYPTRKKISSRKSNDAETVLPPPQYFSDWSKVAMLRAGWNHGDPSLSILYGVMPGLVRNTNSDTVGIPFGGWSDSKMLAELNCKNRTIFSGIWNVSILKNEKPLIALDNWTPTCEIDEPTYNYFELQCNLSGDYCLQRHFFLLADEGLLMLADSVLPCRTNRKTSVSCNSVDTIRYESRIPILQTIVDVPGENNATERVLLDTTDKRTPLVRILPLGLPEWSDEGFTGKLQVEDGSLVLRQNGGGNAIFAPLLFDFNTTASRYPYTWRRLTVGEKLAKVSNDQAVGFRIQLCKKLYLLYRSLTESKNRTVLGHNLVSDLFFGRFDKNKGVEKILEVEEE